MNYVLKINIKAQEQEHETDEECRDRVRGVLGELLTYGINIMGDKLMRNGIRLKESKLLSEEEENGRTSNGRI